MEIPPCDGVVVVHRKQGVRMGHRDRMVRFATSITWCCGRNTCTSIYDLGTGSRSMRTVCMIMKGSSSAVLPLLVLQYLKDNTDHVFNLSYIKLHTYTVTTLVELGRDVLTGDMAMHCAGSGKSDQTFLQEVLIYSAMCIYIYTVVRT